MTTQHNTSLACPHQSVKKDDLEFPPLVPPPIPPPLYPPISPCPSPSPGLCRPPTPFLTPNVPPPPLFHAFIPPPVFNTSLPPPFVPSFPIQPLPSGSLYKPNSLPSTPEDKFKCFKQTWEERYKRIKKERNKPECIKVSVVKHKLVQCFNLIKQLESLANCLQLTQKSLSDEDWVNHCKEAEKIKGSWRACIMFEIEYQAELSVLMENINNPNLIEKMKRAVNIRKKKREYKKRKQKEWQQQKREAKFYSEQRHRQIDLWLENMKDQVSRAKREEDIKREADLVLSDVTAKKAEAKRMLNLLNALAKLRAARAKNLSSGKSCTDHESHAFTEVIDRLKKMWLEQFNGYKVEEEGLKVMLGHAEEERTSVEAARLRKNLKAWHHGIFGSTQSSEPQTFDEFVQIRNDWDTFICAEDAPMASSIPVGWVLPCEPSSQEWAALLQIKA